MGEAVRGIRRVMRGASFFGKIYDERVKSIKNLMSFLMNDAKPVFDMICYMRILKLNLSKNPRTPFLDSGKILLNEFKKPFQRCDLASAGINIK